MENTGGAGAQSPAQVAAENVTAQKGQEGSGIAQSPGAEASQEGSAVKAAAAEARRKLKIDNEEVDEEEVLKVYKERKGHQRAANKELQEGKKAKKQAEEFISMMKDRQKLFDAIQKLGHDPRKLAEEYLAEQLKTELMDPRERELLEAKNKLKAYEELEKRQKEEQQRREADEMRRKFSDDYSKQFVEALKSSGLPPTKPMVAEMAKYIKRAADLNFEMTAEEAAKLVKEDMELSYRQLYGEADPETLVKLLGEGGLQKIRTYDTSRLKDPKANLVTPPSQPDAQRKRESSKRMTPAEWRAFNRK